MGRKPVLALAGAVVTSLALAGGCQSNSGAKPNAWPPPSTTQNKGPVTPGGTINSTNGNPNTGPVISGGMNPNLGKGSLTPASFTPPAAPAPVSATPMNLGSGAYPSNVPLPNANPSFNTPAATTPGFGGAPTINPAIAPGGSINNFNTPPKNSFSSPPTGNDPTRLSPLSSGAGSLPSSPSFGSPSMPSSMAPTGGASTQVNTYLDPTPTPAFPTGPTGSPSIIGPPPGGGSRP